MKRLSKSTRSDFITYLMVIVVYLIMQSLVSAGSVSNALQGQLVPICVYICMAVSLNLTVGISGELSLGHAGFMSVGAFSGVVAAMSLQNLIPVAGARLLIGIVIGGICAAIAGVIVGVPVLRLSGDYLAIVTLAFGEIIKNILNNLYVGVDGNGIHFSFTDSAHLGLEETGTVIINGPMGATGVTKLSTFLAGFLLVMVVLIITQNLIRSRSGRAIMAIRDNRIAAESVGLNITKYKLMAFVVSAAMAGMAGALYGLNYSSVVPRKFDFNTSILILVFVVLGGMGNIRGSVIAAAVLTLLPELLRAVNEYRMLIYAVVLILVMLVTNNATLKGYLNMAKEKLSKMIWFRKRVNQALDKAEGGAEHE